MLRSIFIGIRVQRFFNLNWRKTRVAHIGNFNLYKSDEVFEKNVIANLKSFFSLKNNLNMQASNHTQEIIEKLDAFMAEQRRLAEQEALEKKARRAETNRKITEDNKKKEKNHEKQLGLFDSF